jgi:uncharacterized protein (TIGR03067 family)
MDAGLMRTSARTFVICLAVVAALGRVSAQDRVAEEFGKLQGGWTVTAAEQNGKPLDVIKGGVLTVTERNFALKTAAGNEFTGELRLNPTTSPKQLDFVHAGGTLVWEGIYTADGDVFRLNYVEAGARDKRPTLFATSADSPGLVIVMRRVVK